MFDAIAAASKNTAKANYWLDQGYSTCSFVKGKKSGRAPYKSIVMIVPATGAASSDRPNE